MPILGQLCLSKSQGDERSHGAKLFTQFFTNNFDINITNNFDINISLRELTQHTIEIHIFRPIDFTHMNIYLKSISTNHNVAP